MAFLSTTPIDLRRAPRSQSNPRPTAASRPSSARCAITTRAGWSVRLEYSAYGPMAETECAAIVAEAEERWPVRVALAHRVGDARDRGHRGGRRRRRRAPRRGVRGLPLRDRGGQASGADLEEGVLPGRSRGMGRAGARGGERGDSLMSIARSHRHPVDLLGRPLRNLRISVTDRCNLRCRYCMPEAEYVWLPRASILSFEEIDRLAGIFAGLGVGKMRLTGGEPLLRHDLETLVALLSRHGAIADLALTTNGVLLARQAESLRPAGLRRVTVSLDTLRPERMQEFARSARHADVIAGIDAALAAGFSSVKLNTVVIRGLQRRRGGGSPGVRPRPGGWSPASSSTWTWAGPPDGRWTRSCLAARDPGARGAAIRPGGAAARRAVGAGRAIRAAGRNAVRRHRLDHRAVLPHLRPRPPHRRRNLPALSLRRARPGSARACSAAGRRDEEISDSIAAVWRARADRGAEERAGLAERGILHRIESLRADPRREMHTRGG